MVVFDLVQQSVLLKEGFMPNCIGAERVRLRLSQTDLGDKLGVSRSIIVRIERDPKSATYDQLERMSQLFGCSIQYLLGETDDRLPQKDEVA